MREALWWLMVLGLASASARADKPAPTLALVPFGEAAQEVEAPVRQALARASEARLSPGPATAADVEAARQVGLSCGPDSDECLVKLALFLRVDQLVSLAATRTPEGIVAELILIDAALGRRAGSARTTLASGAPDARLEDAALLLLAPDASFGTLALSLTPASASVRVDGEPRDERRLLLRAGVHEVAVEAPGHHERTLKVEVRPGTVTQQELRLVPLATPEPPATPAAAMDVPAMVLLGVGGGVLLAGATTALALDSMLRNEGSIRGAEARENALAVERVAAVAGGAGLLAAAAGALLWVVND